MAKILIVDDSLSMREMVTATLQSAGHVTTYANDGEVALDIAKAFAFDIVVTDINMPNMDGITLIKSLRSLPDYKYTPLLALTSESANTIKMDGKEAGATGWLLKPLSPAKLLATIERVLE